MGTQILNELPPVFQHDYNFFIDPFFKELVFNQRKILDNQEIIIEKLDNQEKVSSTRKSPSKEIGPDKADLALSTIESWNAFCSTNYGKNYKPKILSLALKNKKLVEAISKRFKEEEFDFDIILEIMKLHPHVLRSAIGFDFIFTSPKWPRILEGQYVDHSHAAQAQWEQIKKKIHEISVPNNLSNIIKGAFN